MQMHNYLHHNKILHLKSPSLKVTFQDLVPAK